MSKELTVKQLLFVENYVKNGFNATNAYLEAGYKVSYNVASINASRLLSNAKIKEVIQNKIDEIIKDKNTYNWIIKNPILFKKPILNIRGLPGLFDVNIDGNLLNYI